MNPVAPVTIAVMASYAYHIDSSEWRIIRQARRR